MADGLDLAHESENKSPNSAASHLDRDISGLNTTQVAGTTLMVSLGKIDAPKSRKCRVPSRTAAMGSRSILLEEGTGLAHLQLRSASIFGALVDEYGSCDRQFLPATPM